MTFSQLSIVRRARVRVRQHISNGVIRYRDEMARQTRDWQSAAGKSARGFVFRDTYTAACRKIRFIIAAKANTVATKSDIFSAGTQQSFPPRDYTRIRESLLKCFEGNETNFRQRCFKAHSFFLRFPVNFSLFLFYFIFLRADSLADLKNDKSCGERSARSPRHISPVSFVGIFNR